MGSTKEDADVMQYDFLIVGAGLFGSAFAHEATKKNKRCLVVDKKEHIGGHLYTESIGGINVHRYGPHIFHTDDKQIWDYVNQFADFNHFMNSPLVNYRGEIYNLPFNMNTFNRLWGVTTPAEAKAIIARQRLETGIREPRNLEEQAISLVGRDVYEKLIKGYTEKQWGRRAIELPPFIIKRIPVRFTYNNKYFNDRYQGIPIGGYTGMIERMLQGSEVRLGVDFLEERSELSSLANKMVYTGMIDEYYDYCFGPLEYRGLRFESEELSIDNFQGNAVVNYTDRETPYTRIIEHKHFEFGTQKTTVITREYPYEWKLGREPYYPINDERNNALYKRYHELAAQEESIIFGGRLGNYNYYDMQDIIREVLELVSRI
jgi:UDP-galactopyranose mutase